MSRSDHNKQQTVLYFEEVLNKQNTKLIEELFDPDYRFNGWAQSAADNAAWVGKLHGDYPGLTFTVEDILGEGEKVAIRWRFDAPAAGDRPAGFIRGTNIITFREGKAVDNRQNNGRTSSLNGY